MTRFLRLSRDENKSLLSKNLFGERKLIHMNMLKIFKCYIE